MIFTNSFSFPVKVSGRGLAGHFSYIVRPGDSFTVNGLTTMEIRRCIPRELQSVLCDLFTEKAKCPCCGK